MIKRIRIVNSPDQQRTCIFFLVICLPRRTCIYPSVTQWCLQRSWAM